MAEKEKKKPVTVADTFGEIATIIVILLMVSFFLGRLSTFMTDVSARFHAALGDLPVGLTPIGTTAILSEDSTVYDGEGNELGTQPAGVTGVVTSGPMYRDGERYWYIDFDPPGESADGSPDGWVKESSLKTNRGLPFIPGDTPVGTDIETKKAMNVYDTPGGKKVAVKSAGSTGTVVGGPKADGGKRYWYIDFDPPGPGGGDGWVAEEGLNAIDGSEFRPGGTPVGREVMTRKDADVFSNDFNEDPESQDKGSVGFITEGPFVVNSVRYWFVDFDEGSDGWVDEKKLTPAPSFEPGSTPVGDRIAISAGGTSIHQNPGGSILGSASKGASGVVAGGPTVTNGERWWYVDFDEGPDGWVRELALEEDAGAPFDPGLTAVGNPAITGVNMVVRDRPAGTIIGGHSAGVEGVVSNGPVSKEGQRYWYVDFVSGTDGWVTESDLRNPDGTAFTAGDTPVGSMIQSKRKVTVYDDAGEKIGTQKINRKGVVEQGPVWRDGQRYWYVDFTSGTDGWVAEKDIFSYVQPSLWRRIVDGMITVVRVLLWILAGLFLLAIGVVIARTNSVAAELNASVKPTKVEDVLVPQKNAAWQRVMELSESDNPSEWKLAIIEADSMLDRMLKGMGYPGDTVGDRLKAIERSDFTSLDDAWEAHKVRNRIAHEGGDFLITGRETRRVILMYKRVFEEFRLL